MSGYNSDKSWAVLDIAEYAADFIYAMCSLGQGTFDHYLSLFNSVALQLSLPVIVVEL